MPALFRCAAALAVGLFAFAHPATAQTTYRWDDGGSGTNRNWDNAANWFNITAVTNDEVPVAGIVQFGTGYTAPIVVNLNGDRFVSRLEFGVPASTTLTGGSLSVSSGVITVYGNQFVGTSTTLPPTGPAVTAPVIIDANLGLGTAGVIDVRGNAELQTDGVISIGHGGTGPGGLVTRQGPGLWSLGGTANTFGRLTLAPNLEAGTIATTRFGDLGNATGGSLGVNASGITNQIDWGVRNRLLFTGSAANQTLAKDIAFTFTAGHQDVYSFETFNASGAVGPNAVSLTLSGTISGDLTNNGAATGSTFNINATSPTDPNFAITLSGNNTFRATVTIQGGVVKLTHDNALGSAQSVAQLGSPSTTPGRVTDAALLVDAGRTVAQRIVIHNRGGDTVYTLGGVPEFTSGTATFTGGIALNQRGVNLVAHGSSLVAMTGAITGTGATFNGPGSNLIKTGTGTVRLTAGSSVDARVEVFAGTLQLQGSGALTAAEGHAYVYTGGTVELNNTAGVLFNRIHAGRELHLWGGTLALVGGGAHVGLTTIEPGASSIVVDPSGGTSSFNLAQLDRWGASAVMGGTVDFRAVNGGALGQNVRITMTLDPTLTNGILGGWATVNGTDWAGYNTTTNDILPFTNYTPFASATATSNALVGGATTDAIAAVNSLKIQAATGGSLNTGGLLTIGTGGVLATGGASYSIQNPLATGSNELNVITDGTLTLNGPVSAVGLNKSGAGTLVLAADVTLAGSTAVNVNAGTLQFVGDNRFVSSPPRVNLTSPAAVGIDLNNTTQTIGLLTGSGSIAIGTGSLTIRALGGVTSAEQVMSGLIGGSGSLAKTGSQSLTLSADNPFTGSITVQGGGLVLTGANAAAGPVSLSAGGSLTLRNGGTLVAPSSQPITVGPQGALSLVNNFDASMTNSYRADRVADGRPIILAGGTISFVGTQLSYFPASETLGALTVAPGASAVRSSISTTLAPGGPAVLTFAGVSRQVGSTVNFGNLNADGTLGAPGNNSRLFFASGMADGFLPWATLNTTTFATYNHDGLTANTNGIQALSPAAQVAFGTAGATDHAFLSGSGSLNANKTVTSLQITATATGQSLNLGANNLAITSGGLLVRGDYSITGTGTLGQAGTELILHTVSTTTASAPPPVTIATPITGSAVTKSGAAPLILTGNSTYSGPTVVASGDFQVMNPIVSPSATATGTGPVTTLPGTDLSGGNATGTAGQIAGPLAVSGDLSPGPQGGVGILTVRNDVAFSPTARFVARLTGSTVGTGYSQLRVFDGDVTLNGARLLVSFGGTPNAPLTVISVTGGTVSGVFSDSSGAPLIDGAVFTTFNGVPWHIDYTPTSVIVAPVPEPASVLGVCAAAAGLFELVRRRRRVVG